MSCFKNVSVTVNDCLKKCQGLFITGIDQREHDKKQLEKILSNVKEDYEKYKSGLPFNPFVSENWKNNLQLISIRFDTPGYNEITKDVSSTFTDKLSAVGGTFGLLTGFSLISGVEILFFLAKFLMSLAEKKKK